MSILLLAAAVGVLDLPPIDRALEWAIEHKLEVTGVSCDIDDTDNDQFVNCLVMAKRVEHLIQLECTRPSAPWQDCREKAGTLPITVQPAPVKKLAKPKPVKNTEGEQMICLPTSEMQKLSAGAE